MSDESEKVIAKMLRAKNLTVQPARPEGGEDKLAGESFEFLRGYHAAMAEVTAQAHSVTTRLQREHSKARPTWLGKPSADHHQALGGGRVSKELGDYAFGRAQVAFVMRKGAK